MQHLTLVLAAPPPAAEIPAEIALLHEVLDLAGNLSATSSGGLITVTYYDLGDTTSYLDYDIDTDLSSYDNTTSKFFSTTTNDILDVAYGGTGTTTFQALSLLYAPVQNTVSEILVGGPGGATARIPSVSVMSGARAFTLIPCGASSSAAVFV